MKKKTSLTSFCCKLREHILVSNVQIHQEEHAILMDCQHGFRAKRSCETQLMRLYHDLAQSWIIKTYPSLISPRSLIGSHISAYCISSCTLASKVAHTQVDWILPVSWTKQVVIEGESSYSAPVVSGVQQSTVLDPLLFLIFINGLSQDIQSKVRLFANDCIIYKEINTKSDCEIPKTTFMPLKDGSQPGLCNPAKCCVMRVAASIH